MNSIQSRLVRLIALLLVALMAFSMSACDLLLPLINGDSTQNGDENTNEGENNKDDTPDDSEDISCKHESVTDGKCNACGEICPITIKEALEICDKYPNGTTERYYIRANVKTISNPTYGEMTIEDSTGEIYVYGTYSSDGALRFDAIDSTPVKGDEVLLHCILSIYDGTKQVKNARLIEFKSNAGNADVSDYTEMTIAEARAAATDSLVIVKGVVARIAYANGQKPSGVILVDSTSSIYIHDQDLAGQVEIGNTVEVAASKTYWVLSSEISNAEKFGYKGANQLEKATVISIEKTVSAFDKSWIEDSTMKNIMDTPVTEDITNKIFKVNALVKKAPGNGFTNYYIDDIDGVTGSYVYTQCNGNDFAWLDEFDGKICTVYVVAMNAKSTSTGCTWRLLPIEVIDEGYSFDVSKAAEFAVVYHGVGQFMTEYTGDPALELVTSVSSELLGFENAIISYTSSNEAVISFATEDGKTVMHCNGAGIATITISAAHNGNTHSKTIDIKVSKNEIIEYITVADAIATEDDTEITVKGIVGPSVVNRNAFYLFGDDGSVIAVMVNDVNLFSEIEIGHEIIVKGKREHFVNASKYNGNYTGQASIVDAVIVANYYGNHDYSTAKFVTGKTVEDLRNLDIMVDYSTTVFVVDAVVNVTETAYYSSINLKSPTGDTTITLYCSGAGQYAFLKAYAGQTVTLELAGCNWNDKSYWTFCALAVVNKDGTKVLNTLNFN